MKTFLKGRESGYALMMTLFFSSVGLLALAGALTWTASTARQTMRNNEYYSTVCAAEAATEKVLANISKDYAASGESSVYSRLDTYRGMLPTSTENSYWGNYSFTDANGHTNKTYVTRTVAWQYTPLI